MRRSLPFLRRRRGLLDLRSVPFRAFDFDAEQFTRMVKDSADRLALIGDSSPNSGAGWGVSNVALYGSGASGATATTPDFAIASGSGETLTFTFKAAPVKWSPAAEQVLWAKGTSLSVAANLECALSVVGGKARFYWSNGTYLTNVESAALSGTDGEPLWLRLTLSMDLMGGEYGRGGYTYAWEKSADGSTWTAAGSGSVDAPELGVVTTPFVIQDGSNVVTWNALTGGTTSLFQGKQHSFTLAIDGTAILNTDFTAQRPGSASFVEGTGKTVTVNAPALIGWFDGNNGLVLGGASGNYASFTALTAPRTGDFAVSVKARPTSLANLAALIGGGDGSFGLRITATEGKLAVYSNNVAVIGTSASSAVSANQEVVFGYVRSSGVGQFYVNGTAFGNTFVDTHDYTPGVNEIGSAVAGTVAPFDGHIKWARVYSAALDATAMAADAAGTVQANCVFAKDFTRDPKLAASVAAETGQIVTINASGASGARISGPRDAYWSTLAGQMLHVSEDSNGCYTTPGLGISTAGVDRDCVNSDGSTANRRAGWSLGSPGAIAGQTITKLAEVQIGASAPAANWWIQIGSAAGTVANGLFIHFYTDGSVEVRQYGATGSDYRRALYANFQTDYAGQWVRISIAITGDSTTKPTITINGVDKTASFATAEAGSYPNWQPTTLSTLGYWIDRPPALRFVPHAPILGALSNAEAVTWTSGGDLPTWATAGRVSGSASAKYTSNFSAGDDSWGNSECTLTGNVDSINGQDDWLRVQRTSTTGRIQIERSMTGLFTAPLYAFEVRFRVYNASATTRYFGTGFAGYGGDSSSIYYAVPALSQVDVVMRRMARDIEVNTFTNFRIFSVSSAGLLDATIPTGDLFYFKNIQIRVLGRLFTPVIQPNQTIADAGTNGITGTLATGCNPILYRPGSYFFADGSDDAAKTPAFSLSQPVNVYGVLRQNKWTAGRAIFDGFSYPSMLLFQDGGGVQPAIRTTTDVTNYSVPNYNLAMNRFGVVFTLFSATSPAIRVNRTAATGGAQIGTNNANGFTFGGRASGLENANACFRRIVGFDTVAHPQSLQDRIIQALGRQKGVSV